MATRKSGSAPASGSKARPQAQGKSPKSGKPAAKSGGGAGSKRNSMGGEKKSTPKSS